MKRRVRQLCRVVSRLKVKVSQTTPGNNVGGKNEALQLPRGEISVVSHNNLRKISLNLLSYMFRPPYKRTIMRHKIRVQRENYTWHLCDRA